MGAVGGGDDLGQRALAGADEVMVCQSSAFVVDVIDFKSVKEKGIKTTSLDLHDFRTCPLKVSIGN